MFFKVLLASLFAGVAVAQPALLIRDPARPVPDARGVGAGPIPFDFSSSKRTSATKPFPSFDPYNIVEEKYGPDAVKTIVVVVPTTVTVPGATCSSPPPAVTMTGTSVPGIIFSSVFVSATGAPLATPTPAPGVSSPVSVSASSTRVPPTKPISVVRAVSIDNTGIVPRSTPTII